MAVLTINENERNTGEDFLLCELLLQHITAKVPFQVVNNAIYLHTHAGISTDGSQTISGKQKSLATHILELDILPGIYEYIINTLSYVHVAKLPHRLHTGS